MNASQDDMDDGDMAAYTMETTDKADSYQTLSEQKEAKEHKAE